MLKELIKKNNKIYNLAKRIIIIKNKVLIKYFHIQASKYLYKKTFHRKINLKNPKRFNEKIMWLKLNKYYKNPDIIKCVDKIKVRDYVEQKVGKDILVPIIGTYNNEKEIEWETLPNQFVLKINTGSGYNIVCKNKSKLSEKQTKEKLKKWLNEEYYIKYADYQYIGVEKKILCEKFLQENIRDYKFFCFHGKSEFFYVSEGLGDHNNLKMGYFDMQGKDLKVRREGYNMISQDELVLPSNFENMIKIAEKLSKDFPFVRVDLYNIDKQIYFSELTFIPTGGLMKIEPDEYDMIWGDLLKL